MPAFHILEGYDFPSQIQTLFEEYTNLLIEKDPAFANYLAKQNYERELENLHEKYGKPDGLLLLALDGNEPIGCAALRKLDRNRAELKRMYVRAAWRKQGVASTLLKEILLQARRAGYQRILLDTLPCLPQALHLYQKAGFVPAGRYNDSPLEHSIFLSLDLHSPEASRFLADKTVDYDTFRF